MTADRTQIFRLAWKSAKGTAASYDSLRAAFAAALRRVWELVKAMVKEEARRPVVQPTSVAPDWFMADPYRARAVANRRARLGTPCTHAW
ncbi:MAG: hypothetical protein ACM33T_10140 [Solirubrobacterales bacterium]